MPFIFERLGHHLGNLTESKQNHSDFGVATTCIIFFFTPLENMTLQYRRG